MSSDANSSVSPGELQSVSQPDSPPCTSEPHDEEDWTQIKDPKKKKRIQNRIAQRTYRYRMKTRLAELQTRVDEHERGPRHNTDVGHDVQVIGGPFSTSAGMAGHRAGLHAVRDTQRQMAPGNDASYFQQLSQLGGTVPHLPPLMQNPLPSPQELPHDISVSGMNDDTMMDFIRTKPDFLSKLNAVQSLPNIVDPEGKEANMSSLVGAQAPEERNTASFTPEEMDSLDVNFKSPLLYTDMHQRPSRSTATGMEQAVADFSSNSQRLATPPRPLASLEERLEYVVECVKTAGFDSFDNMVMAYYNSSFKDNSPLVNAQRLSRNRRLPNVITEVFQASRNWTSWERRGLHEELLKTAESMLLEENSTSHDRLDGSVDELIKAQHSSDVTQTTQAVTKLQKTVQNELPNLWALTMALVTENQSTWQHDQSYTALRIILLLRYSGDIPNEQLRPLLGACL